MVRIIKKKKKTPNFIYFSLFCFLVFWFIIMVNEAEISNVGAAVAWAITDNAVLLNLPHARWRRQKWTEYVLSWLPFWRILLLLSLITPQWSSSHSGNWGLIDRSNGFYFEFWNLKKWVLLNIVPWEMGWNKNRGLIPLIKVI